MKRIFTLLILVLTSVSVWAETPQSTISAMIEKYPTANRKVWYYFDEADGREYMRLQIWSRRRVLSDSDVDKLKDSFCNLWSVTDFSREHGVQYLGPDTISITVNGDRSAAFDLGRSTLSADYAFNAPAKMRSSKPDFGHLLGIFEKVKVGRKAITKQVKYTGFKHGITFTFQRDKGRGWTQGERTTVYGASLEDFRLLRSAIRRFIGSKVPVTVFDRTWQVLVKSESTPDFYAVGYDPKTRQLNFLQATVEDQICIPLDWQKIDYLTNSEVKYTH